MPGNVFRHFDHSGLFASPHLAFAREEMETFKSNLVRSTHKHKVQDARPNMDKFSLEREGFGVLKHKTAVSNWDDEKQIRDICYKEAIELVKKAAGAKDAVVFDHTLRKVKKEESKLFARDPVEAVHLDYTVESAPQRLRDFFGADAEKRAGRYSIINLWRPLVPVVRDVPLAVIDARSVEPKDLLPYALIYPDRVGGNYTIANNPKHKWWYLPQQTDDEVLVFKQWDSDPNKVRFAPHSAFKDPTAPKDGGFKPRESIELRLFVFYDGKAPEMPAASKL